MNEAIGGVIVAAGEGTRLGGDLRKAYVPLAGRPLFMYALEKMRSFDLPWIALVIHSEELVRTLHVLRTWGWIEEELPGTWDYFPGNMIQIECKNSSTVLYLVPGGKNRQDSVRAGVAVLEHAAYVAVHDAARPFLTFTLWERLMAQRSVAHAVVPALPVKDTIKVIDQTPEPFAFSDQRPQRVSVTLPRKTLVAVQTPQLFHRQTLLAMLDMGQVLNLEVTDEAMLWERFGKRVVAVLGEEANIKVTTPFDLALAEVLLRQGMEEGGSDDTHRLRL